MKYDNLRLCNDYIEDLEGQLDALAQVVGVKSGQPEALLAAVREKGVYAEECRRLLAEAIEHLDLLSKGEQDDPAVGITGWNDCHRIVAEARKLAQSRHEIVHPQVTQAPGVRRDVTIISGQEEPEAVKGRQGSDGEEVRSLPVGGAQLTQAGGDSGGMPLSVGRSRPDQTATISLSMDVGVNNPGVSNTITQMGHAVGILSAQERAARICEGHADDRGNQGLLGIAEGAMECARLIRASAASEFSQVHGFATAGNYVADREVYPQRILFANGRTVELKEGALDVGWAHDEAAKVWGPK